MRVSLSWLRELVDIDLDLDVLVERLDMTGTKVEAVHSAGAALDKVVVGEVLTREQHPNADRLSVSKVDVGGESPLEIVCGADNYAPGDRVPVALVGAELPNGMKIKKSKLRGVVSRGMMCSPIELGLGEDAEGLLILPSDAPVGVDYAEYQGLDDTVLELEITPNRPDCLSVAGVAREVAAVTGKESTWPAQSPEESGQPAAERCVVEIAEAELCPRYTARIIEGVTIGPSPEWLARRVASAGARPINNVVDATNFVMFELGQPLHAFDMDTLGTVGDAVHIIVRRARTGEDVVTLDEQDRQLSEETIVIADPSGPVALAGVMGGLDTEVSDATTTILLESASFDPTRISQTSRTLGLISEASLRMERRVDPEGCAAAVDRASALIAEVAGGTVAPGVVDEYPLPPEELRLQLRVERLNSFLGTDISVEEASSILEHLGLQVTVTGDTLDVVVPSFRPDLVREIDLIEEVVRVWGMDRVESTMPAGPGRIGGLTRAQRWRERLGEALRAAGLSETMTYAFAQPEDVGRLEWPFGDEPHVALMNPMSEEQSVLRWTLAPGLMRSVANNQRRGVEDVHLYEVGNVFGALPGEKLPQEREVLGGVLAGRWERPSWSDPDVELGFFDGKGAIETLMEAARIAGWSLRPAEHGWLQPGRSADVLVDGQVVGWMGEVHPRVLEVYEAEAPVVLFELDLGMLLEAAVDVVTYQEVPRLPAVHLDLAVVVDEGVAADDVLDAVRQTGGGLLESVRVFDVYTGEGIAEGKKSLAFALTYRSHERTLTDDEVHQVHDRVVEAVRSATGGEIRS
jgi:phenylalanyl-tRNA synthetase beta chain